MQGPRAAAARVLPAGCACRLLKSLDVRWVVSSYQSPEADSEDPLGGGKGSALCTGEDPPAGAVRGMVVGVSFPDGVCSH